MGPVWVRPEVEIRDAARAVFEEHRRRIGEELPDAEVEHVGATAVPGAWTKGDVDLLVRVDPERFGAAVVSLQRLYAVHQPGNWTPTLASFNAVGTSDLPVGVQLVVAGSADDALFGPFRDALIANPALLAEYNALKRSHDGEAYQTYTAVKGAFVEGVRGQLATAGAQAAEPGRACHTGSQ